MDPISAAIDAVKTVVTRIWPDKTEADKERLAAELAREDQSFQLALAQIKASQGSSFRDGAGWMCVAGFAYAMLFQPIAAGFGYRFPTLDVTILGQMLFALLGLGYMHMNERK